MKPSAFSEYRPSLTSDAKLVSTGSPPSMITSKRHSGSTPHPKKNLLVDRNIYLRQSPLTQRSLTHSISDTQSTDLRKSGATLRDSMSSRAGTPAMSPGTSGRLKVRDGDEKATISRVWEALCLPEDERRYAWNILKNDITAQKAYGCRLRIALSLKKEYMDLIHQRQTTIHGLLILLNENHTKASINTRKRVAELVLSIKSLTSKVTNTLEKARAQCKMPLNLPSFSTDAINQNCRESWYAQLLMENIFTQKVLVKLILLIGFFDDPDKGEFVDAVTVSEAVAAFYKKSIEYGVWIKPETDQIDFKGQQTDRTGTFTQADVSLFLLLGLSILTIQPMDFTSLPEMLSQFLEAASGVPDMPLQSDEIKQLLINEGQRITNFRTIADEYARQGKNIVVIPIQHRREANQFDTYLLHNSTSCRSASGSLFTRYHTPTDGSVMPTAVKPAASAALPKKNKALTDGNIYAILKKVRGELSGPPRPLSNLDNMSVSISHEGEQHETTPTYEQCIYSSGLYGTPDAPSLDEDRPICANTLNAVSSPSNNNDNDNDNDNDSFSIPLIAFNEEIRNKSGSASDSNEFKEPIDSNDLQQSEPPSCTLVEESNTLQNLIIYKFNFTSPSIVNGNSYDIAIAVP